MQEMFFIGSVLCLHNGYYCLNLASQAPNDGKLWLKFYSTHPIAIFGMRKNPICSRFFSKIFETKKSKQVCLYVGRWQLDLSPPLFPCASSPPFASLLVSLDSSSLKPYFSLFEKAPNQTVYFNSVTSLFVRHCCQCDQ